MIVTVTRIWTLYYVVFILYCSLPCSAHTAQVLSVGLNFHDQSLPRKSVVSSHFDWRLSLAGGLAGGISNMILYPIDTLKTMRQSDPSISSLKVAFIKLKSLGFSKIYSGILPAVIGSIPSSAIYFGTYEFCKSYLLASQPIQNLGSPFIYMISAVSGNIMSSVIFVPKDVLKQQLQALRTESMAWNSGTQKMLSSLPLLDVCKSIYARNGIKGFFPNYRATLMRNIPGAVIRFTLYEELKSKALLTNRNNTPNIENIKNLLAGAIASGLASVATTPLDVVKTRLATGMIPAGTSVFRAIGNIAREEGLMGLYAGAELRIFSSALFGGVGFSTFEIFKTLLGYTSTPSPEGRSSSD